MCIRDRPTSASRPSSVVLRTGGRELRLATDRGTFSPGRIDPGTRLLLDAAPAPPPRGRFLDLGCGYGPIALSLATRSPAATVVAVDVNERSRDLTAGNARTHGLENVHVMAPDAVHGEFDLLWSNPPIRIGKEALHRLLRFWLGRLHDSGSAVLVVSKHLGADSLQRWLDDEGCATSRLASKRGYRVVEVRATPSSTFHASPPDG